MLSNQASSSTLGKRSLTEVGPMASYTPTDDCPLYYNGGDMAACAAQAEVWLNRRFTTANANATALTPVAEEPDVATNVAAALQQCVIGRVNPHAIDAYFTNGTLVASMNMSVTSTRFPHAGNATAVTINSGFHGALLSGDQVVVVPSQPALTTLLAPQLAPHPLSEKVVHAFVDGLLRAVPGLPQLSYLQQHRRVAWRRLTLWCPAAVAQLLLHLNPLVKSSHAPGGQHHHHGGANERAKRSLDAARSSLTAATLVPLVRWLHRLFVVLEHLLDVTHAELQASEIALEFLASPLYISATLALFNAPPAAMEEALSTAAFDAGGPQQQQGDLFAFASAVMVPLLKVLCSAVERAATVVPFFCAVPFTTAQAAESSRVAKLKAAVQALQFLLTRLTAVQRLGPSAWPGQDRDLACGAMLRGINATLRTVVPWCDVLLTTSIETALPARDDIRTLLPFSQRKWASLVAASYTFRCISAASSAVTPAPGVNPREAASLALSKDRLGAFGPISHALRVAMAVADAQDDNAAVNMLTPSGLAKVLNHHDLRGTAVRIITRCGAAALDDTDVNVAGGGYSSLHTAELQVCDPPCDEPLHTTPSTDLKFIDAIAAVLVLLPGAESIIVWCRVATHDVRAGTATIQLLQSDRSTLQSLVEAANALEGRALLLIHSDVVSTSAAIPEEAQVAVHGNATAKLAAVYRAHLTSRVLANGLSGIDGLGLSWAGPSRSLGVASTAIETALHAQLAKGPEAAASVPEAVVQAALARRPPPPYSVLNAQAFRTTGQQCATKANPRLTPAQEEASTSVIRAISESAAFQLDTRLAARIVGGGMNAEGPRRPPSALGFGCHFMAGGPGSGKSHALMTCTAAVAAGLAAVRSATLTPVVDALKKCAAATKQAPDATLVTSAAQLRNESVQLRAVQRSTSAVLFIEGARSIPSRCEASTAVRRMESAFSLRNALISAAATSVRAPLVASVLSPRLSWAASSHDTALAVLCRASQSKAQVVACLALTLPEAHVSEFISIGNAAGGATSDPTSAFLMGLETTGCLAGILECLHEVTQNDADDGELRGDALDQGSQLEKVFMLPFPRASSLPSTVPSFQAELQGTPQQRDSSYCMAAARRVVGLAYRLLVESNAQIPTCRSAMADTASLVACAVLLGGSTHGRIAVAAPCELAMPGMASLLAAWKPPVLMVDDADLMPDSTWHAAAFSAPQLDAADLSRTALGSRVAPLLGPAVTMLATVSSEHPGMPCSVWHPSNSSHLSQTPSHTAGAQLHRPWCNAIFALAAGAAARSLPWSYFALASSPTSNRLTRSADVALASCTLRAAGGRLDADADDASAAASTLSNDQAPGLGGSAFLLTFNDTAALRKGVSPLKCVEALREASDAVYQLCSTAGVASVPGGYRTARVAVLPNGQIDRAACFGAQLPSWASWEAPDWSGADESDGSDCGWDALIVTVAPGATGDHGGVDMPSALEQEQQSSVLLAPSPCVPTGDDPRDGDPRLLSRLCARTKRCVVIAAPLTTLLEWGPLRSFADVCRQLLGFRGGEWLLAACQPSVVASTAAANASAQLHVPALPLQCSLHKASRSALLLTAEPHALKNTAALRDLGATAAVGGAGFTTLLGGAEGCCRSVCLVPFPCGQPSHRCLRPCHLTRVDPDADNDEEGDEGESANAHSRCALRCETVLPCGHRCTGRCGDECPPCPHEVLVDRGCGTSVISGFAHGAVTKEWFPHYVRQQCGRAEDGFDEPCTERTLITCFQCTTSVQVPCCNAARPQLCDRCVAVITNAMRTAKGGEDTGGEYDVRAALARQVRITAGMSEEDDGEFDEEDDGPQSWIPTLELVQESMHAVIGTWPPDVAAAVETDTKKARLRVQLEEKRMALTALREGPQVYDVYREEEARVAAVREEQAQVAAQIAADEAARVEEHKAALRAALKAQVDINADAELHLRAVVDLLRRECTACATA